MSTTPAPSLKEILAALKNEVIVGNAYVALAKGLRDADPVVMQTAPTFFGLALDGSLQLSQIIVARLYDTTKGAVTVRFLLLEAASHLDSFRNGNRQQVREAITKSEDGVSAIQSILDSIRDRRNKALAHLDPATVVDPKALATKAKLTIPDLETTFKETERILIEISALYDGTVGDLKFIGGDDYKMALDYLGDAKCSQIKEYEREFGAWTGPRPKKCL